MPAPGRPQPFFLVFSGFFSSCLGGVFDPEAEGFLATWAGAFLASASFPVSRTDPADAGLTEAAGGDLLSGRGASVAVFAVSPARVGSAASVSLRDPGSASLRTRAES